MAQIRTLAPELAEVARLELNEVESRIPQDIQALRLWIEQHPVLKARTDDQFLVGFLRFSKYSLEEAKKRIEYYYTYKSTNVDLLKSRRIDDKILGMCRSGIFVSLPKPVGPGGPRIHFTRMGKIDTSVYTVQDIFRYHAFRSEIEINTDDNYIISGILEVIDFSKIPFAFLRQFEPSLFKKMAAFLEFGVPTNLKGTHIVNASKEAQLILNLVRLVMKQKELLHIHSSVKSLQDTIGKEYLPEEYGGTNGTLDDAVTNFERTLLEYKEYFIEDEKYGVRADSPLSAKSEKSSPKLTGATEGSFRKLDID